METQVETQVGRLDWSVWAGHKVGERKMETIQHSPGKLGGGLAVRAKRVVYGHQVLTMHHNHSIINLIVCKHI